MNIPIDKLASGTKLSLHENELIVYRCGIICKIDKRLKQWMVVKSKPRKDGYCVIGLRDMNGMTRTFKKSRVIYKAFNQNWDINNSHNNCIDHINQRRNDNRISNLRNVDNSGNGHNTTKTNGYSFDTDVEQYRAYIMINSKLKYLGYFNTPQEAKNKYLRAKYIYWWKRYIVNKKLASTFCQSVQLPA